MDVERAQDKLKLRGKLYSLSEDSAWEDVGTGYATVAGAGDARRLNFEEEDTGKMLHDRPVFGPDAYQLQGEGERQTIIVWEDAETQKDWALSFQDADGTADIWEQICGESAADEKRVLPLPALGNLTELCRLLTCVPPSLREVLAAECLSGKFLNGLRDTFHTAEDLHSEESLSSLWQIAKGIFLLSNQKLTERYLKHDVYEDVLGMLEYDAGLPCNKRIAHRQILKVQVRFKSVLSFEDSETMDRIHLNYRLQYLKDIVLPRLLDDAAFVSLTQMIHTNLSTILDHVQKNQRLLEQLFMQIRQRDRQSLHFLQDVCRLAKQTAPSERQALHEKMVAHQLFACLMLFLGEDSTGSESETSSSRIACIEILLCSVQNDPSNLRRFLTSEGSSDGRALFGILACMLLHGQDQGVQGQVAEMFKAVMETSTIDPRERDNCMDTLYDKGALDELVAPLRVDATGKPSATCSLFGQQLSCELLAFAVAHHGYRARAYVMRHGVAQQAMRLLALPQRFLQLAPVRLLRAIVATKDDAYQRYLVKTGVFASLFRALQNSLAAPALGGNLLVSATLEVLECIRVDNMKILVDHICRKHEDLLREHAPKIKTLHLLQVRHEQNMEYEAFPPEQHAAGGPIPGSPRISMRSGRNRSPGREDSDDDEAYFESLDDDDVDDDAASAPSLASPGAIAETMQPQSESPPSAQDVDAAAAGDSPSVCPDSANTDGVIETESSGAIETETSGAVEEGSAADAGLDVQSVVEPPPEDGSMQPPPASESPPRSPGDDSAVAVATVPNDIDVPNHAPKRLKTSASAAGIKPEGIVAGL